MRKPTASIIISAYNRPQVIPFAIRSVLASDFDDWELIVVGDGCNAETEQAIRSFTDDRLRFHNLPKNTGHQSAPHNKGVELARGDYVMFLNQDDMYFPDHIARRIAFMRETRAEISWSPILLLQHSGHETGPVDIDKDRLALDGAVADRKFNPKSFIISSCWAVRKEVYGVVGPWLPPEKTRLSPSQEWLYRAARQGRHLAYHPYVSVICIHSGVRRYSYLSPRSPEHGRAWSWLEAGTAEKLNLLHCVAVQEAAELVRIREALERRQHRPRVFMESLLARIGVHPHSAQRFLGGLGKGEWVAHHKQFTSAAPITQVNHVLPMGSSAADIFLGQGWHIGEVEGRWSSGPTAEIFFSTPEDEKSDSLSLEVCGHPLRAGDSVTFKLDGVSATEVLGDVDTVVSLHLKRRGSFRLTIAVDKPTSPHKLGNSMDTRILGYWLAWLRLSSSEAS